MALVGRGRLRLLPPNCNGAAQSFFPWAAPIPRGTRNPGLRHPPLRCGPAGAASVPGCDPLLAPGIATLWTAWSKFNLPVPPAPVALTLTGTGALAVNLLCAFLLAQHRHSGGSLTRAAFLSARNDTFANLAIIGAGLVAALLWHSAWPDLIVGLGIAAMNADAARDVWNAAHDEHRSEVGTP